MAGKMLCTNDRLSKFLSWDERANMLAGNAIKLFNMGRSFEQVFQERLTAFKFGDFGQDDSC